MSNGNEPAYPRVNPVCSNCVSILDGTCPGCDPKMPADDAADKCSICHELSKVKTLENRWLATWKKHPSRWDTLDDLEHEIAALTDEADKAVSHRLAELAKGRKP